MICKNCGASLPARSMVCRACGGTLSPDQIEGIRQMNSAQKFGAQQVQIRPIDIKDDEKVPLSLGDYKVPKENKGMGLLVILIVLLIVIVIAFAMYMSKV